MGALVSLTLAATGSEPAGGLPLQTGRTIAGLPIYLAADGAIPAAAVPAPSRFRRASWPTSRSSGLALGPGRLGRNREGVSNRPRWETGEMRDSERLGAPA